MDEYILVNINYINLDDGEVINNLIEGNQINYIINKDNNKYELDWIINNNNINIKSLLYNKLYNTLIIITKDDYNSLLGLLYSDNKHLLNYNDMYYIIMIEGYMTFNSNNNLNNKLKKKFIDNINK
tara:strand:+ start:1262 stop:1639 length:378 start_codon:yes stop_codon:yes gene_type:complete